MKRRIKSIGPNRFMGTKKRRWCAFRRRRLGELALVLLFLHPSSLILQPSEVFAQDVKYAGEFLQIPVGSRALSMGGAFTSIADDESAFHWNAAGVSLVPDRLVGLMYSAEYGTPGNSLADFYHLGFTYPLKDMTLAVNWVRLAVGDLSHTPDLTNIAVTDERAQMVQEIYSGAPDYFSDNEDAFVVSLARDNKFTVDWGWLYFKQQVEIPIGVNFKIIHQVIGSFGSSNGIGVDAGAMIRFSMGQFLQDSSLGKISFGSSVTDIAGTRLAWSTQQTQIVPMHITGGISYSQPIPVIRTEATFASDFLIAERAQPHFGLEVIYDSDISLRVGLDQGEFTTGAGYKWENKVDVNYSLAINDALGPEHRLSFGLDLDNLFSRDNAGR